MVRPPYYVTLRLLTIATEQWVAIDGEAALDGVNPITLPLHRFVNYVQAWAVKRVQDPTMWLEQLNAMPIELARRRPSAATMADEGAGFAAFMTQVGSAQGVSRA